MSTSATAVRFDKESMLVELADGRKLSVPLKWFPRLLRAKPEERERVEISRNGLHWDDIDEDISVEGLLAGRGDMTASASGAGTADEQAREPKSPPKVFVSHATEDKPLVVPLAAALRKKGIDAWVDQWEIRAGDSLVQKIFEEGIGRAAIVIIALSKISVEKKWVKEELDAAVVGRINQTSRLIPLLIEECEVPVALRATKWIRFENNFDAAVNEIIHSVYITSDKPSLGSPPTYVERPLPAVHGLASVDLQVLRAIGDRFVQNSKRLIAKSELIEQLKEVGLGPNQIDESLEILSENLFISPHHSIGQKFAAVQLELRGTEIVLRHSFPEFDAYYRRISADLVNKVRLTNDEIANYHSLPLIFINHVLDDLESQGLIKMSKSIGGPRHIFDVSARLKRSL